MSSTSGMITLDIGTAPATTAMSSHVILNHSGVGELAADINSASVSTLLFGTYDKWCSSLIYYPINFYTEAPNQTLVAGGVSYDVPCWSGIPTYAYFGYTLGQTSYSTTSAGSFLTREPYTKLELWLPYYGKIDLKPSVVSGHYIQILLSIDFQTGQAMYTIALTDSMVDYPNAPYAAGADLSSAQVITTVQFQLGTQLNFGSTHIMDSIRNTATEGLKMAFSVASGVGRTISTPSPDTTTVTTKYTERNPDTGRQVTAGTVTQTTTRDGQAERPGVGQSALAGIATVLDSIQASSTTGGGCSSAILNGMTNECVYLVTRRVKPTMALTDETRLHLTGGPVGKYMQLSDLSGFTTVSDIDLTGCTTLMTSAEEEVLRGKLRTGVYL